VRGATDCLHRSKLIKQNLFRIHARKVLQIKRNIQCDSNIVIMIMLMYSSVENSITVQRDFVFISSFFRTGGFRGERERERERERDTHTHTHRRTERKN